MTSSQVDKISLTQEFWQSPDEALFNQTIIAIIRCCSNSTLERERWAGNGIPYIKIKHKCLYRKSDVVNWLNQYQRKQSTSQAN